MSTSPTALRLLLHQHFPDAVPLLQRVVPPVATGIAGLDAVLPGGGLPRGKLTTWTSAGGALAVLRAACHAVCTAGDRAAWIDGTTLSAVPAAGVGRDGVPVSREGLYLRPTSRLNGLRSAEVVLRSAGFGLVVVTGLEPEGTETVRLTRAAREGNCALVVVTARTALATLRITSRIQPHSYHWLHGPFDASAAPREATIEVRVRTLGVNATTALSLPVTPYELRLSLDCELADRRGQRPGDAGRHSR